MKRIDITEQWETLSANPGGLHAFVLDQYGADRSEQAPWPHAALYKGDRRLGLVDTYGYPRIVEEDGRIFMELADLEEGGTA